MEQRGIQVLGEQMVDQQSLLSTQYGTGLAGYAGGSLAQNCQGYNQIAPQWGYCYRECVTRDLRDFELQIEQQRGAEPKLNFGEKLRLLIADPIQGIDLREAISKLKIALKQAYERRT